MKIYYLVGSKHIQAGLRGVDTWDQSFYLKRSEGLHHFLTRFRFYLLLVLSQSSFFTELLQQEHHPFS